MAFLGLQSKAVLIGLLTIISLAYTIDNELHRSFQFGLRRSLTVNNDINRTSSRSVQPPPPPPPGNGNGSARKRDESPLEDDDTYGQMRVPPASTTTKRAVVDWADDNYSNEGCDLGGQQVKVAVAPQAPMVDCAQDQYGDWSCSGSNIEVISLLAEQLHFRPKWVVLTSMSRTPGSDGNLTGVIGIVTSGKALLSANGLVRTADREANLLLSEPFDFFRFHFLLSKSVRDHDQLFLKPFSAKTWWALLGSGLAVFPVMYLINATSSHYAMRDDPLLRQVSGWRCARYVLMRTVGAPCRLLVALCRLLLCCWCWAACCCCCCCRSSGGRKLDTSGLHIAPEPLDKQVHSLLARQPNSRLAVELARRGAAPAGAAAAAAKLTRQQRRLRKRLLERQWALERRRARRLSQRKRKSGFSKWPYTLWYVVGSLAYQGGEEEDLPTASSTRILVMFWWFYLIVVSSYHSGILTAILSFPRQPDFIQTLDDYLELEAAERGAVKLWTDLNGELAELLASPDNLHKSALVDLAGQRVHKIDFRRQRQRLLDVVASGRGAYMEDRSTVNLIITQDYLDQRKCLFKSSRFPIDVQPMSLVLSQRLGPACIRFINKLMVRILRTGLSLKWRRQHEPLGNECLHTVIMNAGTVAKIEMRHVLFAFWLLGAGLVLGAVVLVLELVWLFTADLDSDSSSDSTDHDTTDDQLTDSSSASESAGAKKSGAKSKQQVRRPPEEAKRTPAKKGAAAAAAAPPKWKKRFNRVSGLFSALLEGRVYAGFLNRLSDNVHNQARRASQALLHLPRSVAGAEHQDTATSLHAAARTQPSQPPPDEPIRRRQVRRLNHTKVAPQ